MGPFQILGTNYAACRFHDVETYVAAMMAGEKAQLDAFAAFCQHGNLVRFLKACNWTAFARAYKGSVSNALARSQYRRRISSLRRRYPYSPPALNCHGRPTIEG